MFQVSLAKDFKFEHELKLQVQYEDVFKPTTVVQKGKGDRSKTFYAYNKICILTIHEINTLFSSW